MEIENIVKTVYVPMDPSESSKKVIPIASDFARSSKASLCFIHATTHEASTDDLIDILKLRKDQLKEAVIESLQGPPATAIQHIAMSHPHSLVVMSMHSITPRPKGHMGPVALEVLEKSNFPIVFVPPEGDWEHWQARKLLLPQDSTAECASAIAPAIALASAHNAELIMLHVPKYSDVPLTAAHGTLPLPRYMDQPQHELAAWREEFIERLRQMGHIPEELHMQLVLGMAEPAKEILHWSKTLPSDLIVLPWYRNFKAMSVLKEVLDGASCPVMALPVLRAKEQREAAA